MIWLNLIKLLAATILALALPALAAAQPKIAKISDTVIDAEGLTITSTWGSCINGMTYQRYAHVSHNGYQYAGYYDKNRNVCLARRRHQAPNWEVIRLTDYKMTRSDSHNTISIGICKQDGTIHVSFDHHGHPLNYRVSQKDVATNPDAVTWDKSLFGPVLHTLGTLSIPSLTYPVFLPTPDGGLQFLMRQGGSGGGDKMLYRYNPNLSDWALVRQIDNRSGNFVDVYGTSTRRNSYPNDYQYDDKGRLHGTWCWREGAWAINHSINYAYSDDQGNTWHNNAGTTLSLPMRVTSPGLVAIPLSTRYGLVNDQAQAVDSQGRVHVVMYHSQQENTDLTTITKIGWSSPGGNRYHHYWRDNAGNWTKFMLPWASGNRPKLLADREDNLFLIYQAAGNLRIARASGASNWTDWAVVHNEPGPFFGEMLADPVRMKEDNILSVFAQEKPSATNAPSPVRVLEFYYGNSAAAQKWDLY